MLSAMTALDLLLHSSNSVFGTNCASVDYEIADQTEYKSSNSCQRDKLRKCYCLIENHTSIRKKHFISFTLKLISLEQYFPFYGTHCKPQMQQALIIAINTNKVIRTPIQWHFFSSVGSFVIRKRHHSNHGQRVSSIFYNS